MNHYKLKVNFMELVFVSYIPGEVEYEIPDQNGNEVIRISKTEIEDPTKPGVMYSILKDKKQALTYFGDSLYYIIRERESIDNVFVLYRIINDSDELDIDNTDVAPDAMWNMMNADLVFSDDYLTSAPKWIKG